MGIFSFFSKEKKEKLDQGLEKTKTSLFDKISKALVGKTSVDDDFLDQLEEILVTSDVGIETTLKIIDRLQKRAAADKYINTNELNKLLKEEIAKLFDESGLYDNDFSADKTVKPYVIMVVGVNGVGKTTTIGKLAHQFKSAGKKVVLCHYPIACWNRQHHGSWHLHGHSHGNYKIPEGKILDVGLDSAYNIYGKHCFFDEAMIEEYMKTRSLHAPDGHIVRAKE